jgi:hypothetical protein
VWIPIINPAGNCAGASGNWSFITLNGEPNNPGDESWLSWLRYGYPGYVDSDIWLHGDTGNCAGNIAESMNAILGQKIDVPVYDEVRDTGQTAEFHIVGFVSVTIDSYNCTGSPESRGLSVTFNSHVTTGRCCESGTPDTGLRVVFVCAVDASDPQNCEPT